MSIPEDPALMVRELSRLFVRSQRAIGVGRWRFKCAVPCADRTPTR